ncbi:MAG: hypothetical protein IJB97_00560 [Clostridia bacterium]|nr:hypothetical protein [Clostridia bacterium]
MGKIFKRIIKAMVSFALAVVGWAVGSFPTALPVTADTALTYEQTNVLDDLIGATVNGEKFSLADYNFDETKETQVISFVEYCYSAYENKQDRYVLYVYVYNPQGLAIETSSPLNKIQLGLGNERNVGYTKYPLLFLNSSLKENYEGMFYKFKVVLTNEQKREILEALDKDNRVYKVSGIELHISENANATEYAVGTTYEFSGFADGYGEVGKTHKRLTCKSEQSETLKLNVHSTQYRPEGTNGKNDYTQDSLHSVYFAVPNTTLDEYGTMSEIHATWLNAVLKPALVTGNQSAYKAILGHLGENIGKETDAFDYGYLGAYSSGVNSATGNMYRVTHSGFSYNRDYKPERKEYGYAIKTLYMLFNAGEGLDSADHYTVSSEELKEQMLKSKSDYGGVILNGKYSAEIFESYDKTFTDVHIRADEKYSLTSKTISMSWWDMLFKRNGTTVSNTFDGIQAIYPVKPSDTVGDAKTVSDRLYIAERDYNDFNAFYEKHKSTSTVYLFRYQVSDYMSQEATLFSRGSFLWLDTWEKVDTNAYFFQETVNLDFDVIDVTFSNGKTETVLPVVASPIDVIPGATPPVHTTSDEKQYVWLWLLIIVLLILLAYFAPVLSPIINFAAGILCLPFKWLGKFFGWLKARRARKQNDES